MSIHVADIYTHEAYDNLRPLFANWEPTQPVRLGDYGLLVGRTFVYQGNITDHLGIAFGVRRDPRRDHKAFTTSGRTEVKFHGAGSFPIGGTVNARAVVEVAFTSERAVFFNAADCQYAMIDNKVALGREIHARYRAGTWRREWCVITDTVTAGATTIAVSGGATSSIVFEATGNVPAIDLADASIGLTTKSARNIGYQLVAPAGLTPLFGLCRIKPRFLWFDDGFRPLAVNQTAAMLQAQENVALPAAADPDDESLIFGQIE